MYLSVSLTNIHNISNIVTIYVSEINVLYHLIPVYTIQFQSVTTKLCLSKILCNWNEYGILMYDYHIPTVKLYVDVCQGGSENVYLCFVCHITAIKNVNKNACNMLLYNFCRKISYLT